MGVDHYIIRMHDDTDIDLGTSDRHHHSRIDNGAKGTLSGMFEEAEVWGREVKQGAD